jgi:hypothetical protein
MCRSTLDRRRIRRIVALLLFTSFPALSQTFLNSIPGPGDISVTPDLQQPDTPITSRGDTLPTPSWPNYCAPVSAANIWEFFDNRDGTSLSPWSGDLPQPGPPYGWGTSWSTATIQGQGVNPATPSVYMNTNGIVGGPWFGTLIADTYAGAPEFAGSVASANGLTKTAYRVPPTLDEAIAWVPVNPPVVNQTNEATTPRVSHSTSPRSCRSIVGLFPVRGTTRATESNTTRSRPRQGATRVG